MPTPRIVLLCKSTLSLNLLLALASLLLLLVRPLMADNKRDRLLDGKDTTTLLLSRLNLNAPGLEKVKASAQNPERAARELLSY